MKTKCRFTSPGPTLLALALAWTALAGGCHRSDNARLCPPGDLSDGPVGRLCQDDPSDRPHIPGESPDLPLDDLKMLVRLQLQANRLANSKNVTPAEQLRQQAQQRHQCTLALARPADQPMGPAQIYHHHKPGVLIVSGVYKCPKCSRWHCTSASGFVIGSDGVFVTNYHVIASANKHILLAMTDQGRAYPVAEVLAADQANDVAICRLDLPAGRQLHALALTADAPPGTPVTVISHPTQNFYTLTTGHVSRYFRRPVLPSKKIITQLAITADYARGSSGAPLFDDHGNVIGMVKATSSIYYSNKNGQQKNLQMVLKHCVPAQAILDLIRAPQDKPAGTPGDRPAAGQTTPAPAASGPAGR